MEVKVEEKTAVEPLKNFKPVTAHRRPQPGSQLRISPDTLVMVLLILRRIPTSPNIRARVGDHAHITDIMQDMQITPGQARQLPAKGRVHHNLQTGYIQGRVAIAKERAGKGSQQPYSVPHPNRHLCTHP